jgi:hypothetical protein
MEAEKSGKGLEWKLADTWNDHLESPAVVVHGRFDVPDGVPILPFTLR